VIDMTIQDQDVAVARRQRMKYRHLDTDGPPKPPSGGACVNTPTDLFFPGPNGNIGDRLKIKEAKKICAQCRVQTQCLVYALEWEPYGIWGGHTESQRIYLRRKLQVTSRRSDEAVRLNNLMEL